MIEVSSGRASDAGDISAPAAICSPAFSSSDKGGCGYFMLAGGFKI